VSNGSQSSFKLLPVFAATSKIRAPLPICQSRLIRAACALQMHVHAALSGVLRDLDDLFLREDGTVQRILEADQLRRAVV
jgi:hypothetical protein